VKTIALSHLVDLVIEDDKVIATIEYNEEGVTMGQFATNRGNIQRAIAAASE
jgi:hypothetical protein